MAHPSTWSRRNLGKQGRVEGQYLEASREPSQLSQSESRLAREIMLPFKAHAFTQCHSSRSTMASFSCCDHMCRLEEKISIKALEELACRLAQSPSAHVQTPAMQGSFNLVYAITFPDGRKWVARIPEPSFTDSRKIESMIGTMRLISDRTSLPLPVVYAYDSTPNNSLGYAYMFTSFIEGVRLSGIWTKPGALTDANRRHIFQQIANSMAQLRTLEFDRIGALDFSGPDLSYTIGPLRTIEEGKVVHEIGPFPTSLSYINELASSLLDTHGQSTSEYVHCCVLRLISLFLPNKRFDGPPFVLSHPDFDSQNVMVDPQTFTITGFIDWDDVSCRFSRGWICTLSLLDH